MDAGQNHEAAIEGRSMFAHVTVSWGKDWQSVARGGKPAALRISSTPKKTTPHSG